MRGRLALAIVAALAVPAPAARAVDPFEIQVYDGSLNAPGVASIELHKRCGFRVVGMRERIAQLDGVWRDTVLMERRSEVIE